MNGSASRNTRKNADVREVKWGLEVRRGRGEGRHFNNRILVIHGVTVMQSTLLDLSIYL